jgi:catechol 2,3-dioxygenase-like lactoylglutathione lyase family enzyme
VHVQFVSTIAVITPHPEKSRELFVDALGLPLEGVEVDGYAHSEEIEGVKSFGVWPLAQAARACFGTDVWPADRPAPQVSIEFDVESPEAVQAAAQELEARGFQLVHAAREEPWGQTVARLLSIEGAIIGISFIPSMHSPAPSG